MTKQSAKESIRRYLKTIIPLIFLAFCLVAFWAGIYVSDTFPGQSADELFFYLFNNAAGQGGGLFIDGMKAMALPFILSWVFLVFLIYGSFRKPIKIGDCVIFPIKHKKIVTAVICVILLSLGLQCVGFFSYIFSDFHADEFIEMSYVEPSGKVKAPEKKRNLLIIEVESLETTVFTREQGGGWDEEVCPELYALLSDPDAVYFAVDGKVQGTPSVTATTWTTAALVSYTSGLPFKIPWAMRNSYRSDHFMQGAYTIGDTLKEQGYKNVLISGAMTNFGGVGDYFTNHGSYDVIDVNDYWEYGFSFPNSQRNEWGFSDEVLMMYMAKEYIENYDSDQPLHLMLSTIDTHFNGYLYEKGNGYTGSETKFGNQTENVYATTSRVVGEFISWLKTTEFYKNTTVLIIGDHENMLKGFCDDDAPRGRYNVILNGVKQPASDPHRRVFTPMDFYPTVLSAMGFEIEGDRLALGVDLYADIPTLAEINGIHALNNRLNAKSDFFDNYILGDDAEWLKKMAEEDE